ncbi:flagellar assembly protein FliX [Sphingomonas sp. CJ20]
MRIEGLSPILARSLLAALPKGVPSFPRTDIDPRALANHPVSGPGAPPMPTVEMLVALAVGDPGVERRRKQAAAAERGIDALDRLHKELVAGTPSVERLREVAEWSQSLETPDNPVLASILKDIDLRVRVELAKFDVEA